MPTYEYECDRCAHTFERFQNMTDVPLKRCPKCKGKVRRIIGSGAGLLFKGSGFYITDYRNESYKNASKSEQSASTGGEGGSAADKKTASTEPKGTKKKKPDSKPK